MKIDIKKDWELQLRKAFEMINEFFGTPIASGFRKFSQEVNGRAEIPHTLGAVPQDIILTWTEWTGTAGTITINYSEFTNKNIVITTTQPCKIRGLIGIVV